MNKVYVVSEYGGEYEDKWQHIIGVCSSRNRAEKLKDEILDKREPKTNISIDEYQEMLSYLYDYADKHDEFEYDTEVDGLLQLFPDKDVKDIEEIDRIYFSYDDFTGVDIEEIDFYN